MATTQLKLYNASLRVLGEEQLASLSENREPKRILDGIWDDGFIDDILEQGYWNFATRTIQLDYEPSITPTFGYRKAFEYPTDFINLASISADEYFSIPLTQYRIENGFIWCDHDRIYISYISNDVDYGNDLSLWPRRFQRYAEHYLALQACERLTQNRVKYSDLFKITEKFLIEARNKDAMNDPTKFPPPGSWTTSRTGSSSRRDRGYRGSLVG